MTRVRFLPLLPAAAVAILLGCAGSTSSGNGTPSPESAKSAQAPSPDPRVGLKAGLRDAGEAVWNLKVVSENPAPEQFAGITNSDMGFTGKYLIQGNYNGFQVWDIEKAAKPKLVTGYVCPASQSDVSVYKNLLFVSGEDLSARLDCGAQGVQDTVSKDRLRGLRVFDISDIHHPRNVGNVQTCRGSHTHSLLIDPKDSANVYVYISGSSVVRSASELPGCTAAMPNVDPNTAWFRIEVIKVPVAHPEQAAIVNSPRIFDNLVAPPTHGDTPEDSLVDAKELAEAKARGAYTYTMYGQERVLDDEDANGWLSEIVQARGGSGTPTAADSAVLRQALPQMIAMMEGVEPDSTAGPTQCHDITLYPAIGLAGGACEGYGLLLDISDPVRPVRIHEVSDSNFSYWHSATFNNDGTKLLFSDEWGGGSQPKCRVTDKKEWGADAIFTVADRQDAVPELLQAAGAAGCDGNLRGPQRLADPGSGARHHGPGLVPGRTLGVRVDRPREAGRDRLLRSRAGERDRAGERWVLVHLLVQRPHLRLGDGARARRLLAHPERLPLAERDRRGQLGEDGLLQRPGAVEDRLAHHLRAGPGVSRPARAVERTRGRGDQRGPGGARLGGEGVGHRAAGRAQQARLAARDRLWIGDRRGQGSHLDRDGTAARRGAGGGTRRGH